MTVKRTLVADISAFQPDNLAFFRQLKGRQVKAVIVKISQGSEDGDAYYNQKARKQIQYARQVGLLVHAYHYARYIDNQDAKKEADWFIKNMKRVGISGNSVAVVDVEDPGLPKANLTEMTNRFIRQLHEHGYPKTDVYTMASWLWERRLVQNQLGKPNLWVARYGAACPGINHVGTWQFTDHYQGMNVDMSLDFNGFYTTK